MSRPAWDAARWAHVREAVADALEQPPSVRAQLLAQRLGDDGELLAEARALLASEARAEQLEPWTFAPGPQDEDPWVGRTLQRWRIVALLGVGGMGRVYRAERIDAAFEQEVALKLLHAPLVDAAGRARFEVEQRALARLEHPGIARLIDAGLSPQGVPFFVLERVTGQTIDHWCDARALDTRARVALARDVCAAVHAAHGQLVVHGDLKPSNVLVDAEGRTRLVDFGVARLLDAPAEPLASARAWTPRYASPEQHRGAPVTVASDVFSLGILLHVLLAGVLPMEAPAGTDPPWHLPLWVAAERAGTPRSRVRALRGDLDAIVARALSAEPLQRYASVAELSDELGRWMAHEPVHARGSSSLYRASRFVRRHAWAVGALVVVLTSLGVALAVSLREARAARAAEHAERSARALAERRFEELRQLAATLVLDVHDRIRPTAGTLSARAVVLDAAADTLQRLAADTSASPESSRELSLELIRAWVRLGDALGEPGRASLGRGADARGAYDKALALAVETAQSTGTSADTVREARYGQALALARLAELDARAGDVAAARAQLERGLALRRELARDDPAQALRFPDEGALRCRLADVAFESGRLDEAQREIEGALTFLESAPEADEREGAVGYARALAQWRLGRIFERRGDSARSEAAFERSLAGVDDLVAAGSQDQDHLRHVLLSCIDLGRARLRRGDLDGAQELAHRALEEANALLDADPQSARALDDAALAHNLAAELAGARGDLDGAREHYAAGLELRRERLAAAPEDVEGRRAVAKSADFLALALRRMGRAAQACDLHEQSLATFEELARDDPANAEALRSVAVCANWAAEARCAVAQEGVSQGASEADRGSQGRREHLEQAAAHFERAVAVLRQLESTGRLAPSDAGVQGSIAARLDDCLRQLTEIELP